MAFTFGSTPVGSIQKKPTKKKPTFSRTPTAKEKTNFRKQEEQATKKSIGTAGPKKTGDPSKDRSEPTAAQKIAFRQQEETYLTQSPGTVGDKYYKNPEGTGTGQGGSGIPKDSKDNVVTTTTPPMDRPESVAPQTVAPPKDEVIVINLPAEQPTETPTMSGLTVEDTASIFATDAIELDRGNQIPLLLKAFETQTSSLSIKPRLSLNKKGTFLRGFDVNFKF